MKNIRNINEDLYYIGVSDRKTFLFENVYPLVNGASYNSYLLSDEKTVLFNTVDKNYGIQFLENIVAILGNRTLDYFVINHIEPDHGALIKEIIEKYPSIKIICNAKTKQMIYQFFEFDSDVENNFNVVKEGDILETGKHKLTFIMAPMVHWPEVMVAYDLYDNTLYSADAFGAFGALDGNLFDDEVEFDSLLGEYRRYYTNIVGKYGPQVCALLNKAKDLDIKIICPLHGHIIRKNISKIVEKYSMWATYTPEIKSVLIPYASIYGSTQNASEILASRLSELGIKNIKMYDVSTTHSSYILADAFKYSHIVLSSITYNNGIFSNMENFIRDLVKHNLQNRTFAIIQNGSWVAASANCIKYELEKMKNIKVLDEIVTIASSVKKDTIEQIEVLAQEIAKSVLEG